MFSIKKLFAHMGHLTSSSLRSFFFHQLQTLDLQTPGLHFRISLLITVAQTKHLDHNPSLLISFFFSVYFQISVEESSPKARFDTQTLFMHVIMESLKYWSHRDTLPVLHKKSL